MNYPADFVNKMVQGNCLEVLKQMPENSIDLIVTSPPYADSRVKTYGGIHPDKYVDWFLPIGKELLRILKPSGTFILNIKEKVVNCERHTYVLELIIAMRKLGWLWTEEFIWHKKNCFPGKWKNRFRDAWERCIQFNKTKDFKMFQEAVMVPVGEWSKTRLKNIGENDKSRLEPDTKSGLGRKQDAWVGREMVYPSNVLQLATECSNKKHSAAFPNALPEWFIKLFTIEQDTVLDPFAGSGTTLFVAKKLNRNFIGIEINKEYCEMVNQNLTPAPLSISKDIFVS